MDAPRLTEGGADATAAQTGTTRIWVDGAHAEARRYDRLLLRAGNVVAGPAIVTEMDSTTLILPGHSGTVDPVGSIIIRPNTTP